MSHILEIKDLQVQYHTEDGTVYALNHVDLELDDGETLGLVGETGAGKTTLAKSIMRLIPDPPGKIEGGVIEFGKRAEGDKEDDRVMYIIAGQVRYLR